jgi:hypothetical protein
MFVVHPEADSATLPPFSGHPDALSTVPQGLREARRGLGPTACAFARRLHSKQDAVREIGSSPLDCQAIATMSRLSFWPFSVSVARFNVRALKHGLRRLWRQDPQSSSSPFLHVNLPPTLFPSSASHHQDVKLLQHARV